MILRLNCLSVSLKSKQNCIVKKNLHCVFILQMSSQESSAYLFVLLFTEMTQSVDLKQNLLDQASSHVLKRGGPGYGFTVRESCPVRIGHVKVTGSAYQAGIQRGDYIIRLNGVNVLNETPDHVANAIR